MSTLLAEPTADDLRKQLSDAAPSHGELIIATLVAACQAKKTRMVRCRKCGTSNEVEIEDAVAASAAAKTLIEQTAGRPGVADDAAQAATTVRRIVVDPAHVHVPAWLTLAREGKLEDLRAALEAAVQESDLTHARTT